MWVWDKVANRRLQKRVHCDSFNIRVLSFSDTQTHRNSYMLYMQSSDFRFAPKYSPLGASASGTDAGVWTTPKHSLIFDTCSQCHEAFAAQYISCERLLGLDRSKTNVNGSGIGLGHPVGSTGGRSDVGVIFLCIPCETWVLWLLNCSWPYRLK